MSAVASAVPAIELRGLIKDFSVGVNNRCLPSLGITRRNGENLYKSQSFNFGILLDDHNATSDFSSVLDGGSVFVSVSRS